MKPMNGVYITKNRKNKCPVCTIITGGKVCDGCKETYGERVKELALWEVNS